MELIKCILTNNDCYKTKKVMTPKGIVVHSTGVNNKTLKRYVQPDDGVIGLNKNNNHWNRSGVEKCVNAFIGVDKNGDVKVCQTLPWNYAPWGCGLGSKGTYNKSHIQFEICEDGLRDEKYFNEVMQNAIDLCIYLCKMYNLSSSSIVSHHEAYMNGYGSNHADCDHWLKRFGKTMTWFRAEVEKGLFVPFKVKVINPTTISKNPKGTGIKTITNGIFTITEVDGTWGKLKSGAGWINIDGTNVIKI